jgi:hypothetical protein
MPVNLTDQIDNYAIYLPAISPSYAHEVVRAVDEGAPSSVSPADLNFLDSSSRLWSYKWCLASAGHLASSRMPNAITTRQPDSSMVFGDSGGYQVATGALPGMKKWTGRGPDQIAELWRTSNFKSELLRWLDLHCDYAMTLDVPLWLKSDQFSAKPFYSCSVTQLTDLTVENLSYFDKHRGVVGNCKFLNVLHGRDEDEEAYWYRRVRDFEFEGWALGGSDGRSFSIKRVLRTILMLRDDGMLGDRREWLHVLGISQLTWSVALTAMQRGIQASIGSPFNISFDTSTPFLWAGKYQKYLVAPTLTRNIKTWAWSDLPFPVGYLAATRDARLPFPAGSPLSDLLKLGDVNRNVDPLAPNTFNSLSTTVLSNHNLYVFLLGFIDANEKTFRDNAAPQAIADMVGVIEKLFASESWSDKLDGHSARLEATVKRTAQDQIPIGRRAA